MMVSRKVAQVVVLAIALALSVVLVVGMWRGKVQKERQSAVVAEPSESEMKLTDIEFTDIQDGRRFWTLRALEARYFQDEQKTQLKAVRLTFFLEEGGEVVLESQDGILNAGSKNIELFNSVRAVLPYGYEIVTDRVYYDHTSKVLYGDNTIGLTGPELDVAGNRWWCMIPQHQIVMAGRVQATVKSIPAAHEALKKRIGKSETVRPR